MECRVFPLPSLPHQHPLVAEERTCPAGGEFSRPLYPYAGRGRPQLEQHFHLFGIGGEPQPPALSTEILACALAQVCAARVLPPLTDVESGAELLNYRVKLREVLHEQLVLGIAQVLKQSAPDLGWVRVDEHAYLSVIGAGVAACVSIAPGAETLSLRWGSALAAELRTARSPRELPRSLSFLQAALHECIDALLKPARVSALYWLAG